MHVERVDEARRAARIKDRPHGLVEARSSGGTHHIRDRAADELLRDLCHVARIRGPNAQVAALAIQVVKDAAREGAEDVDALLKFGER